MRLNQVDEIILDLGVQPVSNRFINLDEEETVPYYPMILMLEKQTGVVRLQTPFPVEEVKPRYDWLTCFEPEDHLDTLVQKIIKLPGVNIDSVFAGYSFKDDSTLDRLKAKNYLNQCRINPREDLGVTDSYASVETFQSVFSVSKAEQIQQRLGYADVMIVRHVIEHAYDLQQFVTAITTLTNPDGYIVWELPDCERSLNEGDCTTIWEEHIHYFTRFTVKQLLENSGFTIVYFESLPYPLENSIVAITKKNKERKSIFFQNVNAVNKECERAYLFAKKVNERKKIIQLKLNKFKERNGPIAIFGAGHLTVAFISIMEVDDMIDFVIDDNPNKKGMIMPIGNINILGSDVLYNGYIKLCLLGLNPQNQSKVIAKHDEFINTGGIFASIFPGTHLALEDID